MDKKAEILKLVPEQGVLPLFFNKDTEVSIEVLKALYNAGVRTIEYTNRGEAALVNFTAMVKVRDAELPGLYLGIGTIKNAEQAEAFVAAGADYLISPGLVPEVVEVAKKHDILYVPGAMSPSEIIAAENMGITFVKLFPGNILGPGFVSAVKEVFPALKFMATGGVELEEANLKAWFASGVAAVGMGSKLITKKLLEEKNYEQLAADTVKALQIIKEIKAK
jgi:2-dehydro-3-deoxyphosphogluconate aldolase/(4S)-4-hydroxy-2-oxoglutarate aldolase